MTVYNWLTILGVPGMFAALISFIRVQVKQNRALKNGMQAILRDRLLQRFQECRNQGGANSDERQNFENLYIQYHSLGGNGVMDDVRRRFFILPMEKERNEKHD